MLAKPGLKVEWLRLALQDMQQYADFIAKDNPEAAKQVAERIWQAGQSLTVAPERGRPGRVPGTRELVLSGLPYFLAYRVKIDKVQILRVIHGARHWP